MSDEWERRERAPWWAVTFAILTALAWCIVSLPTLLKTVGQPFQLLVMSDDYISNAQFYVVGAVIANAVIIAAAVTAILFLVFVREKTAYRAMNYFFLLFVTVIAVDAPLTTLVVMDAQKNRAQWRTADLSLRQLEYAVLKGGSTVDTHAAASGDAGIVEGYLRKFLADTTADRKSFQAEVTALDYPAFMKPERLAARGGLRIARTRLAQAHALVAKYRAELDTRIASVRQSIDAAPIATADKEQVEADFNNGVTRGAIEREEVWQLEDAILADLEEQVTLLQDSRERWFLQSGRFMFMNRADLQAFNANVRELNALQIRLKEEDETIRQMTIADVVDGLSGQ